MDRIVVKTINVGEHAISCRVVTKGKVSKAFREKDFIFTYRTNVSLAGCPESIAVVPLLGSLLPISWIFNTTLEVETCDADFLRSIPDIKQGYRNMYPTIDFEGELKVLSPVENEKKDPQGCLTFFSGGLDSHDTALRHADEKPALLILRGADISITEKDDGGWEQILEQVDALAETLGTERLSIETNFRDMMNYRFLNDWAAGAAGTNGTYWYCFQHGIAIITHAAPLSWQKNLKTVYIASSYTEDDEGKTTCASDPTIDNYIRFCGTEVIHDGYAFNRNKKLENVAGWCRAHDAKVYLRVCHSRPKGKDRKDGKNCCSCEKCYRTILGLYAIREDPNRYGFEIEDFPAFFEYVHERAYRMVRMFNLRYLPIIRKMRENYSEEEIPDELRWFYDFKLSDDSELFHWIDRRVVIEHEKRMAAEIALRSEERRSKKLEEELELLKATGKE